MEKLGYLLFRILCFFIGIIPLQWFYSLSTVFSFVLQYVIRYQKNTIDKNLRNSFPAKDGAEIQRITRGYYKNLSDVVLEKIKGYSLNIYELMQRYECLNPEVANDYFKAGQSVIFALSHYANWEWGTQVVGNIVWHDTFMFYKPLSNKYINEYIRKHLIMRGMELCSINQAEFVFHTEDDIPRAYFLMSDKNPSKDCKVYWVKFLNQDTACIHDVESYARLFNLPVIYAEVQRKDRGHYNVVLEVLCENPWKTYEGEITERYMKKLEDVIVRNPDNWIWSHKKWELKKSIDNLVVYRSTSVEMI